MIIQRAKAFSGLNSIPETLSALLEYTPDKKATVIDVGCGRGVYGYLLRSFFKSGMTLIGTDIEIDEYYRPALEIAYDQLILGSAFEMTLPVKADLVFVNHVLEHFPKENAFKYLDHLKAEGHSKILVGLPSSRKGHEYKDKENKSPHSHKWGIHDWNYSAQGFTRLSAKTNNLFLWQKGVEVEKRFI